MPACKTLPTSKSNNARILWGVHNPTDDGGLSLFSPGSIGRAAIRIVKSLTPLLELLQGSRRQFWEWSRSSRVGTLIGRGCKSSWGRLLALEILPSRFANPAIPARTTLISQLHLNCWTLTIPRHLSEVNALSPFYTWHKLIRIRTRLSLVTIIKKMWSHVTWKCLSIWWLVLGGCKEVLGLFESWAAFSTTSKYRHSIYLSPSSELIM